MLCDGRAKTVLEEDIFREVIIHAMQTVHGERERRYRQAVDDSLESAPKKAIARLCVERDSENVVDTQMATEVYKNVT